MMVLGWSRVSLGWCVAYGSCGLMVGMFGAFLTHTTYLIMACRFPILWLWHAALLKEMASVNKSGSI